MKQHVENGQGVLYEARLKILLKDGRIHSTGFGLEIIGATDMEIRLFASGSNRLG